MIKQASLGFIFFVNELTTAYRTASAATFLPIESLIISGCDSIFVTTLFTWAGFSWRNAGWRFPLPDPPFPTQIPGGIFLQDFSECNKNSENKQHSAVNLRFPAVEWNQIKGADCMTDLELIRESVAKHAAKILDANDRIWDYAELAFHEHKSAELLCRLLEEEGFTVQRGLAEIPTCFTGTYKKGSGKPVMGFLGENALSSLSQQAALPEKSPVTAGAPGHGCGHCALGTGSLAAAFALKDYLDATGEDGTVIYFGCPAEEGAGSKQFMARAGLFDDVDFVYTWHPSTINGVESVQSNAIMGANFRFKGRTSHAAASPHLGRSALDAVELMSVGCNYLRETLTPRHASTMPILTPAALPPTWCRIMPLCGMKCAPRS